MTDMLGIALGVETSGLKQGGIELDKFAAKGVQAGSAASQFTGKIGALNTGLKSFGRVSLPAVNNQLPMAASRMQKFTAGLKPAKNAVQLLAYQAQDLAVQLSMGTSALVAFGQQSPQAFSALGPSGAVLGAIAGVGFALAGPLITAFTDSTAAADSFQSKIDDVTGSLKSTRLEISKGSASLLRSQIEEAKTELEGLENISDRIGGRRTTGLRRKSLEEQNAPEIARIQADQLKKLEALKDIELELLEIEAGKSGIQTDIPEQNFDSFRLSDYFQEQQDLQTAADKQSEDSLIRKLAREDILWTQHRDKQKRDEQKLADDKKRMRDLELSTTADLFGNLASLAAAGGEESFTMYKRMAQAQAGVSAGLAILNALAAPTGNPVLNGALAVTIGALAGVQIAQIESQQYSGGRAMGGQVSGGNSYMVGEMGPEIITMGAQGGFVTPNHKLGGGDNITVVNQIGNGVQGSVRAEILAAMPSIISATSKAARSSRR